MKQNLGEIKNYREYLIRYAEVAKQRRANFSLGAWAKALGLKSTSSLTKVLKGEREVGPDLLNKLVHYFKFNSLEESQFRNLVALSKMKENGEIKIALAETLIRSQNAKDLRGRMLELDQFELLYSYLPLAVRELTRLPEMKIVRIAEMIPGVTEKMIQDALHLLTRLGFVRRDEKGHFLANDDQVASQHEVPSEAIQSYHESSLDLAKEKLKSHPVMEREFQSLVLLMNSSELPKFKEKIRNFMDSIEAEQSLATVDQLYQLQVQLIPISKRFEEVKKPVVNQKETHK